MSTSKSAPNPRCFNDFDFQIALARRRGANFVDILDSRSFATPVFRTYLCELSKRQNYGKTQHFAQFLPAKTSLLSNIDAGRPTGNFQYSRKLELLNFLWTPINLHLPISSHTMSVNDCVGTCRRVTLLLSRFVFLSEWGCISMPWFVGISHCNFLPLCSLQCFVTWCVPLRKATWQYFQNISKNIHPCLWSYASMTSLRWTHAIEYPCRIQELQYH